MSRIRYNQKGSPRDVAHKKRSGGHPQGLPHDYSQNADTRRSPGVSCRENHENNAGVVGAINRTPDRAFVRGDPRVMIRNELSNAKRQQHASKAIEIQRKVDGAKLMLRICERQRQEIVGLPQLMIVK